MSIRLTSGLFGLLLAFIVAGCCGGNTCECEDAHADSLFLSFNVDSLSGKGFRAREISTVWLIRQDTVDTATDTVRVVPDTVRVVRPAKDIAQPILLEHAAPFTKTGTRRLPDYNYVVYLPNTAEKRRYELTELEIKGDFEADGCCTCYRNTQKKLLVNKEARDVTSPNGDNEEVPLVLSR